MIEESKLEGTLTTIRLDPIANVPNIHVKVDGPNPETDYGRTEIFTLEEGVGFSIREDLKNYRQGDLVRVTVVTTKDRHGHVLSQTATEIKRLAP